MRPGRFSMFCSVVFLFALASGALSASKKPTTAAELAVYKGKDRQQILEAGAKKEGLLVFYTTGTQANLIVKAFQEKYPYIRVVQWRAESQQLVTKIFEEYQVGRRAVDVVGSNDLAEVVLEETGLLQAFYSPEAAFIEESACRKAPGGGIYSGGHFESARGLGWNTKLVTKDQIPKTYQDLLDPKWKGQIPLVGSSSGPHWIGCILANFGEEFLNRLAKQEFVMHMVSGRALCDMIVNREYAFSPIIIDSHVDASKQKGAPIEWLPLEPASTTTGQIMLPKYSSHPHAAMLYIDFDLSKEAGEIYKKDGYNSVRKDIAQLRTYKKYYTFSSTAEMKKLIDLFNKLFIKK